MISDIKTLRTLGSQIGTGKGAALMAQFGPYAKAIGVDLNGLDEVQAYEAIISQEWRRHCGYRERAHSLTLN